ncbi:MAG TPA: RDD family protein [Gaiellales bacterium]|jgi:uncharacterized RDD family membrane protein YckC|nr:RDD family protein [Gaiellales bacterium]
MTDAPAIEAAPVPAPVRARAPAGLLDLVWSALLILVPYELYPRHGVLIGLLLAVAAFSFFEANGGQTPGKRLLGLEVRSLDGTPCDGRAAVIRTLFRFLDAFPGIYLIGGLAIVSTKRRQRLGDQAAGTSVYRRAQFAEDD